MPMILSSSLDCSCRLWSISNGACIKEFYLYNPVFSFDVCQTSFAFGLGDLIYQFFNLKFYFFFIFIVFEKELEKFNIGIT